MIKTQGLLGRLLRTGVKVIEIRTRILSKVLEGPEGESSFS